MIIKKTSAFILSLCVIFSAVSCAKTGAGSGSGTKTSAIETSLVRSDKNWFIKELPMPEKSGDMLAVAPLGDGRYIAAFRNTENIVPGFYITDKNFSDYTFCNTGIEFRENTEINICFACAADGTVYAAVTEIAHGGIPPFNYLDPESVGDDFDWDAYYSNEEYFHTVYKLSADGNVLSKTVITGLDDGLISDFTVCGGRFYISCGNIYTADENSGTAEEYSSDECEISGNIGVTADDMLVCSGISGMDVCLLAGDDVISLDASGNPYSHISVGGNDFDIVFTGKNGVYGMKDDVLTEIALNVSLGISENSAVDIFPSENGYILRVFDSEALSHRLYLLTDTPDEDSPQTPVTLKLGVLYQTNDFSDHVAAFNRSGKNITIEPVYYTEYDVYDKSENKQISTGTDQLAMDLITGNGPDMAVFMNMPFNLNEKGAFTDMYSLMDDELSRDMFMPNILEACEYNGKLFSLPTSFQVRSLVVKEKFSTIQDQTFEDMLETADSVPENMAIMNGSKQSMLIDFISYADYAVSCENGKYSVNAANMENLLEFCNRFPDRETEEWYDIGSDEVLFCDFAAGKFGDFRTYYEMSGEPITFAGYPSENALGSVVNMTCNVAVMEDCRDKAAAWEFVKSMYVGNNSSLVNGINMEFPIIKKDFEQLVDIAESSGGFTQDELEKAVETVKSARRSSERLEHDLYGIITEEAQPFFDGECTAAEAAYIIKNRTDIYISENE